MAAKANGDFPNFENLDNLNLSGEEPVMVESPVAPEAVEAEPAVEAAPVIDTTPAEKPKKPKKQKKQPSAVGEKPAADLSLYATLAAAVALPVIMLGIASIGMIFFSTAIFVILLGFIPLALWATRTTTNLYVVFLGISLAAILTAIYFLWIELGPGYHFDVKAQEAKQRVGVTWHVPHDWQA